jgi:hypothetical protein
LIRFPAKDKNGRPVLKPDARIMGIVVRDVKKSRIWGGETQRIGFTHGIFHV